MFIASASLVHIARTIDVSFYFHPELAMRQILVCFILFTNVVDFASPVSYSIFGAYKSVKYITENCKPGNEEEWSKKVTINTSGRSITKHKSNSTENSSKELTAPTSYARRVINWIKKVAAYVASPVVSTKDKFITIKNKLITKVGDKIKRLCSLIPEPIGMPNVNLTKVHIAFQAYDGSISGFRKLCERHANFPLKLTRHGLRLGVKYQLPMEGLHFHYHVVDERLGIDHNFNWTLGLGSSGEIKFMIGFSFPCVLTMEDIDLRLDFDGTNGRRECGEDCKSILGRMKCYLYYGMVQTFGLLSEPLKYLLNKNVCVSFKRMGLQVPDKPKPELGT